MPVSPSALVSALVAASGNQAAAARALGISRARVGQLMRTLTDAQLRQALGTEPVTGPRTAPVLLKLTVEEDATIRRAAKLDGRGHLVLIREAGVREARAILARHSG